MDPQVQASFIPKKALTVERHRGGGLLFLLALLFFIASLVAAGASFTYEKFLNKSIADQSSSLKNAEGAFNPSTIEDLIRMDARINESKTLLEKHVAPSALFDFLADSTLERVQFTKFEYALQGDGTGKITLSGVADTFSTVALQSDEFGKSKVLSGVIFSEITVGQNGKVTFGVNAIAEPSLLQYKRKILETVPAQ